MNRNQNGLLHWVTHTALLLTLLSGLPLRAQTEDPPAPPAAADTAPAPDPGIPAEATAPGEAVPAPETTDDDQDRHHHHRRGEIVRFGTDITVEEGKEQEDVVCLFGTATIKGRVTGDVVGVGSKVIILGTVEGDVVAPLGEVELGPQARVEGDLVVPLGTFTEEPGAYVEGERVVIPWDVFKDRFPALHGLKEWTVKGLFLGRPIPHQAGWWWVSALAFAVIYLLTALIFPKPISATVDILAAQPVGSFFAGVLGAILIGPLLILLLATGVGIIVVPFVLCAALVAFLFGKVAVCSLVGLQIGKQTGVSLLQSPLITLVLGLVVFTLIYMIPVVGFLVWGVVVPLGFGAAILGSFRAFRSEGRKERVVSAPQAAVSPAGVGGVAANVTTPTTGESVTGSNPGLNLTAPAPLMGVSPAAADDPTLLPRAGFWIRLLATLIDFVPYIVVLGILNVFPPLGVLLWAAYHVGFWAWKGTTIGGIVLNLRLIRMDGRPVDLATAIVRSLASCISAFFLCLGFFWAGWNRDKQSWHDLIAGTTIVRVPKGIPLI